MRIRFNASVRSTSGQKESKVVAVVMEPRLREVTDVIIRHGDGLEIAEREVAVPMSMVERWSHHEVVLRLTPQQLNELPTYRPGRTEEHGEEWATPTDRGEGNVPSTLLFTEPGFPYGRRLTPEESHAVEGPGRVQEEGLAPHQVEIRNGASVEATDGKVGEVEGVLLDPYANRVTSIRVRRGLIRHHVLTVPVEWVAYADRKEVRLSASKDQAEQLVGPPSGNYLAVGFGEETQEQQ